MSEDQKVLRFKDGKLVPGTAPEWFNKAKSFEGNWDNSLTKAGAILYDDYGEYGDTIQVYKTPDNGYFVSFWDVHKAMADVFVDDLADYLTFRAQYIAPLAQLIMAEDQHLVWQEDRKTKDR
jgi:hypothetical protein